AAPRRHLRPGYGPARGLDRPAPRDGRGAVGPGSGIPTGAIPGRGAGPRRRSRPQCPVLIRLSEAAAGRTLAPGLRTILERCLDPDPSRRYPRASELAEDLDRWRTDRPPAFTAEPFWG